LLINLSFQWRFIWQNTETQLPLGIDQVKERDKSLNLLDLIALIENRGLDNEGNSLD
jgi:hypothetical protein